jgi:hypothetical protein
MAPRAVSTTYEMAWNVKNEMPSGSAQVTGPMPNRSLQPIESAKSASGGRYLKRNSGTRSSAISEMIAALGIAGWLPASRAASARRPARQPISAPKKLIRPT